VKALGNVPTTAPRANVFLTFDDGPDPDWTPRVLDLLAAANARAAFFVIGQQARRHADLLRSVAAAGHVIGNHTYSHRHPWTMRSRAARDEVRRGAETIEDVTGVAVKLYRAPHGRLRRCMRIEAERGGQRPVHWTVSAIDWGPLGTASRIASRLERVTADDVVLMHDGRNQHNRPDQLTQVLPQFLADLRRRGIEPVACSGSSD
jgi:peptidoglycan/xylan/chitin deacetylase (PgdA/CDA1 family)